MQSVIISHPPTLLLGCEWSGRLFGIDQAPFPIAGVHKLVATGKSHLYTRVFVTREYGGMEPGSLCGN